MTPVKVVYQIDDVISVRWPLMRHRHVRLWRVFVLGVIIVSRFYLLCVTSVKVVYQSSDVICVRWPLMRHWHVRLWQMFVLGVIKSLVCHLGHFVVLHTLL